METATLEARYRPAAKREGLAICLSGGGYRAALFHAGALRRLNQLGILSRARTLSSVSGGSIANGLLACVWSKLIPDGRNVFTNFQAEFEGPLRAFCSRDIRTGPLLWRRINPLNWPPLMSPTFSATDFLADEYRAHLVGSVKLTELPSQPRFILCAANLQTGVNFEFSRDSIGDYVLGHTAPGETTLAEAVAASSSFPVAFPPLVRDFEPGAFRGGDPKALPTGVHLTGRLSLTDGGVYDNMGLEPAWKTHATVLVSDGGTPFFVRPDARSGVVPRLYRSYQVIANQAEAVRKRWLVAAFLRRAYRGAYWGLGTDKDEYLSPPSIAALPGYSGTVLDRLRVVRTDLDRFRAGEQSVLMSHGWALANAAMTRWGQGLGTNTAPGTPPDEALLASDAALAALDGSDRFKLFGH